MACEKLLKREYLPRAGIPNVISGMGPMAIHGQHNFPIFKLNNRKEKRQTIDSSRRRCVATKTYFQYGFLRFVLTAGESSNPGKT